MNLPSLFELDNHLYTTQQRYTRTTSPTHRPIARAATGAPLLPSFMCIQDWMSSSGFCGTVARVTALASTGSAGCWVSLSFGRCTLTVGTLDSRVNLLLSTRARFVCGTRILPIAHPRQIKELSHWVWYFAIRQAELQRHLAGCVSPAA